MDEEQLSRRSSARIVPPKNLQVSVAGSARRYLVGDISLGGLSLVSNAPLPVGSVHDITLTHGDMVIHQRIKAVHSRQVPTGWLVGCAFVGVPRERGASIENLMDEITGTMITFPLGEP